MQNAQALSDAQPKEFSSTKKPSLVKPKKKDPLPIEEIKKQAKQREKKQPFVQRLVKSLSQSEKIFRELVINVEPLETRVALLENGILEDFEVENRGEKRMVGSIFKGKIQNLQNGLNAAFVDIGQEKNTFIHYWDILPGKSDQSIEVVRDNTKKQKKGVKEKPSIKEIPQIYPVGTPIVVQITKDQIGSKGPRVTTNLSIPGRFLVLMPYSGECGISRKIEDPEERKRLRKILKSLTIPPGMGVIMRTAGKGKKTRYFVRDLHILLKKWESVSQKIEASQKPCCVYEEPGLIERSIRDFLTEEVDRVLIDSKESYEEIIEYVSQISPRSKSKITYFQETIPIFERFNIEKQIDQTFQRNVPLPSGGEIVIQETEAMITIDVNTAGHKFSGKDNKNYVFEVNMEATQEIARQLRARKCGGIVVIDYIDMKNGDQRRKVYREMCRQLSKHKSKHNVLPISQFGTMQISLQRHEESNASSMYECCPNCQGEGIVKTSRTMSIEIQRRLVSAIRRIRASTQKTNSDQPIQIRVVLNPMVLKRLRTEDEEHLVAIQDAYNAQLKFISDAGLHKQHYMLFDEDTNEQVR